MREGHHHRESRVLITAPTDAVLTLTACKAALGISGTGQDAILTAAIAATTGELDPAAGGWLGRALRPQTWELRLPSFTDHDCRHHRHPPPAIALPFPPLIAIVSVKYDDLDGVERTLVEDTDFRVLDAGGRGKQAIAPLYGGRWPQARCDIQAVRIRFQAGYPAAVGADPGPATPDRMPPQILQAVALGARALVSSAGTNLFLAQDKVEGLGEKRYAVSIEANQLLRSTMEGLVSPLRVFG